MIFETHAHYDDAKFDTDREMLLADLPQRGISPVINVGSSIATTKTTLSLAQEADLPVIIHSRDAAEDTMQIMKKAREDGIKGVIHCYSYSPEMAQEYVKMGYRIGVGGVVTFKNARKLVQTVEEIPLSAIVLETDCPYMAPEPHRGTRNDSRNIPYVIEKIAKIKGISAEEVEETTRENAFALFSKVPR